MRFISINDGYDSIAPNSADESLIIPLKNIINEGYAKDISVKVSTALETRKKQGKFTGEICTVRISERSGGQEPSDRR